MTISFESKISDRIRYDIYINTIFVKKVVVFPNKKTKVDLEIADSEFELSIKPDKTPIKTKIYNWITTLLAIPLSYFLFSVTWESGFMPSNENFHFKSEKKCTIKNQKDGELDFEITKGKVLKAKNLSEIKLNIIGFKYLSIENQSATLAKDVNELKNQLFNLILLYFFWFFPVIVLFSILLVYGSKSNNFYLVLFSSVFLFIFICAYLICVFRSLKIYDRYKLYLKQKNRRRTHD